MALYVEPYEIREWLGIGDRYKDEFLIELIEMKMDYVNRLTATAWNGEVVVSEEYHDITRPKYGFWVFRLGYPIYLDKMYIKRVLEFKLFDGGKWVDILQEMEEGREKGYWIDYINGVVYLNRFMWPIGGREIYIKYEAGRDDLPGYIKELTLLLCVRDLLINERTMFQLAEGASGLNINEQLRRIDERISSLEEMVRAVRIGTTSVSII